MDNAVHTISSFTPADAMSALRELAAQPEDTLPTLAAVAETGFADPDVLRASMVALVDDLLGA